MMKNSKIIGLALLALVVTSCQKDYFDLERYESIVSQAFPVQNVDPNHKWSVTATATANVAVEGDYDSKYVVKIYRNNPLVDGYGKLIATGKVKSGEVYTTRISYPRVDSILYVATVDEKGFRYLKPVTVQNGELNAVFGNATTNGARSVTRTITNSLVNIPTMQAPTTFTDEILVKSVEANSTNTNFNNFPDEYRQDYWSNPEHNYAWEPKGEPYIYTDPDYVINFKISGEWTGVIQPLGNAGYKTKGLSSNRSECLNGKFNDQLGKGLVVDTVPKTMYITKNGKWIIPEGQKQQIGEGIWVNGKQWDEITGIVIVGEGAELVVNGTLNMTNMVRLIVLPGGKVTGKGRIEVTNGTMSGKEGYNGGEVSVATFNQNGGIFFNYGKLTSNTIEGGAGGSTFVNHKTVHVANTKNTPNLHIKNNCWFEVDNNLACKVIENGANSYIKADSLTMSESYGSSDLTSSYMALDNNSLVHVDTNTSLNKTSIIGPTLGDFATVEFNNISYLNYSPQDGQRIDEGKIINNLNVSVNSIQSDQPGQSEWFQTCFDRMFNQAGALAENRDGNGAAQLIEGRAVNTVEIPANECFPGYTPDEPLTEEEIEEQEELDDPEGYRFCFEDYFPEPGDYDFNDVVMTLMPVVDSNDENVVNLTVSLDAAGTIKQNAAALRLVGIKSSELISVECTSGSWFDLESYRPGRNSDIIGRELGFNTIGKAEPEQISESFRGNDVVIPLFNDVHLAINPNGVNAGSGLVNRPFYNTTNDGMGETVEKRTITLKLTFSSSEVAQSVTATMLDAFIIESLNGAYWEVHTYPYKADQVFANIESGSKVLQLSVVGYPWGIMVPDKNFRYPLEFTPIGSYESYITGGAYRKFAGWAMDQSVNTDWYNDADSSMVY